ncbi:MAG: ABC transporter ATP-binding protein, partial [Culicoidibacterales bacterium]
MMQIKNLTKIYDKKVVVDDVSFTIKPGTFTSLIGPNGAGKSTVLAMMSRLLKPSSGEVELQGLNIFKQKDEQLAKQLAILKQANQMTMRITVEELVAFGRYPYSQGNLTAEDHVKIEEALVYLVLTEMRTMFIDELSGGQKQRAFIAMVLAQDTQLILLDEPLNNLDMKHAVQIMQVLRRLVDELGKTVVIVIHDINFASCYSDEIIALKRGKLIIHDQTTNVMQPEILSSIYDMPMHVEEHNGNKIS